jgi:hypothetical protein
MDLTRGCHRIIMRAKDAAFPDTAATVAQLFARAHIVLAALKAHGQ